MHGAALDLPDQARGMHDALAHEVVASDPTPFNQALERWADHVEAHLDWRILNALIGLD